MSDHLKTFIYESHSHPYYEEVKDFLLQQRPIVPTYDYDEDNTERWKYLSAKQEGFDLIMKLLKFQE